MNLLKLIMPSDCDILFWYIVPQTEMLAVIVTKMPCTDKALEMAKIMLEAGANINAKDLLLQASKVSNERMCLFLLEHGYEGTEKDVAMWMGRDPAVHARLLGAMETHNVLLK